jgi:hypothetical protein
MRHLRLALITFCLLAAATAARRLQEIAPAEQAALDRISPKSLQVNLSRLSSDEFEGRGTPSRGLDLAAEYIAARFRSAGLEPPLPDGSYFQLAKFDQIHTDMSGFKLTLRAGSDPIEIAPNHVRIQSLSALDLTSEPALTLPDSGAIPPIAGRVVAGDAQRYGKEWLLADLQSRKPAVILLFGRARTATPETSFLADAAESPVPVIRVYDSGAMAMLRSGSAITVSLHLARPDVKEVLMRNVAAILRGSDPALRNQAVLLTAHYDHLGRAAKGIYEGANDNASGTVSVIEIGAALATLNPHPKRTILFIALFGEEEGLLGSRYYARHPLVPLKNTIADINLEQMGRTDEQSGRQIGAFAFTGPSFSDLPALVSEAARAEGVNTYNRADADLFFDRSDNLAFAERGVIAHTIAVAFEFPDYHGLGDTPDKIDYANMAKVDRGVAAGILRLADDPDPPKWSDSKAAGVYREAGQHPAASRVP